MLWVALINMIVKRGIKSTRVQKYSYADVCTHYNHPSVISAHNEKSQWSRCTASQQPLKMACPHSLPLRLSGMWVNEHLPGEVLVLTLLFIPRVTMDDDGQQSTPGTGQQLDDSRSTADSRHTLATMFILFATHLSPRHLVIWHFLTGTHLHARIHQGDHHLRW